MWLEAEKARNFNAVVWVLGEVNGYLLGPAFSIDLAYPPAAIAQHLFDHRAGFQEGDRNRDLMAVQEQVFHEVGLTWYTQKTGLLAKPKFRHPPGWAFDAAAGEPQFLTE